MHQRSQKSEWRPTDSYVSLGPVMSSGRKYIPNSAPTWLCLVFGGCPKWRQWLFCKARTKTGSKKRLEEMRPAPLKPLKPSGRAAPRPFGFRKPRQSKVRSLKTRPKKEGKRQKRQLQRQEMETGWKKSGTPPFPSVLFFAKLPRLRRRA